MTAQGHTSQFILAYVFQETPLVLVPLSLPFSTPPALLQGRQCHPALHTWASVSDIQGHE